jgi:AcrR family transcriptional regulator
MLAGVEKRRARTDDDKATRFAEILDAARHVLDGSELDGFTMEAVAARLGLVKGTLYRYVPTREALLLALFEAEFAAWCTHLEQALTPHPSQKQAASAVVLSGSIIASLLALPRFTRLLAILQVILERNIPHDTAREFKTKLLAGTTGVATSIERAIPGLKTSDAVRLLVLIQALVAGLHASANPSPVVRSVLNEPQFALLRVNFEQELRHGVSAFVHSLIRTT